MGKKQFAPIYIFLLAAGIGGMLFTVSFDLLRGGQPEFGITQLAGFVVCTIIALVGWRKMAFPQNPLWDGSILLIYLAGVLFMGLKPDPYVPHQSGAILPLGNFGVLDLFVNIVGFIPLGYLTLSYFHSAALVKKRGLSPVWAMLGGVVVSLVIELLQYRIPGRFSSMLDLLANGLGTFAGICYFQLEQRFTARRD